MLTTNGSKRVDLSNPAEPEGLAQSMSNQIYNSVGAITSAGNYASSYNGQVEAYIFSQKFFQHNSHEFQQRFEELLWITYCKHFKPLLIELDSWLGKPVQSYQTDNTWGCTVRCLQMLLANSMLASGPDLQLVPNGPGKIDRENRAIDILRLFNNDKRAGVAPFSIQNVADVGLKDFGVYPGQWYGINTASLIFESLEQRYRPVKNFRICTF